MIRTSTMHNGRLSFFTRICVSGVFFTVILLTSSCATGSAGRQQPPMEDAPPRTELVLLNISEASGWIAYRKEAVSDEVEDYRIVVIRQADNALIYDSVIPLAADLATHGFELAQDDPRLQDLAENVEQNIIAPLEAVMPEAEEQEYSRSDATDEPTEPENQEASVYPEELSSEEDSGEGQIQKVSHDPYSLISSSGENAKIQFLAETPLATGDRLFVRMPDHTIALPGTGEEFLISRGAVTGLVEVVSTEASVANVTLINGTIPENAEFELDTEQ